MEVTEDFVLSYNATHDQKRREKLDEKAKKILEKLKVCMIEHLNFYNTTMLFLTNKNQLQSAVLIILGSLRLLTNLFSLNFVMTC